MNLGSCGKGGLMNNQMVKISDSYIADARAICAEAQREENHFIAEEQALTALPVLDKAEAALRRAEIDDAVLLGKMLARIASERADVYKLACNKISRFVFRGEEGSSNAMRAERHIKAMRKCRYAATELSPEDPAVWYNLGLSHTAGGDVVMAGDAFQKATLLDPEGNVGVLAAKEFFEIEGKYRDVLDNREQREITARREAEEDAADAERAKAARAEENRRANLVLEARRAAIDEVNGLEGTARKALLEQRLGYGQCPLCASPYKSAWSDAVFGGERCEACRYEGRAANFGRLRSPEKVRRQAKILAGLAAVALAIVGAGKLQTISEQHHLADRLVMESRSLVDSDAEAALKKAQEALAIRPEFEPALRAIEVARPRAAEQKRLAARGLKPAETQKQASSSFLSDQHELSAGNIHGGLGRDRPYWQNALIIDGVTYQKGLVTHASEIGAAFVEYSLAGSHERFTAHIGLAEQNGACSPTGSVRFAVMVDGQTRFTSPVIRCGNSQDISLSVADGHVLRLEADNANDGINSDHAAWGSARLE